MNLTKINASQNKNFVFTIQYSLRNKVAANALSPLVFLTGNFLYLSGWASKEVSWEGVFAFCDYETEVIAV